MPELKEDRLQSMRTILNVVEQAMQFRRLHQRAISASGKRLWLPKYHRQHASWPAWMLPRKPKVRSPALSISTLLALIQSIMQYP
jgi:hypothetical protein